MDRRRFGSLLAGAAGGRAFAVEGAPAEVMRLTRNGWMPNNDRLPVLLYHGVAAGSPDRATAMEELFKRNGWPPQWRNGVYPFHHFHSTAHEVLGFAGGSAKLVLGGEGGRQLTVRSGDVLLLPAGTGHCKLEASPDFLVIGAYPEGESWDICRAEPDAAMLERMRAVRFPKSDPVSGAGGALVREWIA